MRVIPDPEYRGYNRPKYYKYLDTLDPLDVIFTKFRAHGLCPPNKWARIIMKDADILQWMNHNGRDIDPDRGMATVLGTRFIKAIREQREWVENGNRYGIFATYWWSRKRRPRKYAFVPLGPVEDEKD